MKKIVVRTHIAVVEAAKGESSEFPTQFVWEHEYDGGGDNSRFYGGQLQKAVYESARRAILSLVPITDLDGMEMLEHRDDIR